MTSQKCLDGCTYFKSGLVHSKNRTVRARFANICIRSGARTVAIQITAFEKGRLFNALSLTKQKTDCDIP